MITAVGALKDPRALTALLGALNTGNTATKALADLGPIALEPLTARLKSADSITRNSAVRAISQMLDSPTARIISDPVSKQKIKYALITAADDQDPFVRISAVEGMPKLRDADVIPLLKRMARSDPYDASMHGGPRGTFPVREAAQKVALALRDQFQFFAIENTNCSVCFSAPLNYFSNIRSLAEPAVRFYDKVYLGPFSPAETDEYVQAIFDTARNHTELGQWLHSKTGGHPYFIAFICRHLAGLARGAPTLETAQHWPEIFERLEKEKFRADLAHVTDREVQLLRALARSHDEEITMKEFEAL